MTQTEKRPAEEQLVPDEHRSGTTPAISGILPASMSDKQKEMLLRELMLRFSALAAEKEVAVESLRVAQLKLDDTNAKVEATVKDRNNITHRLLAAEDQVSVCRKAQQKAETNLRVANSQLMSIHARAAVATGREVATRKELDSKVMEVAGRTECPICYSLANVPGHEPYRLGCPEGHVLCYECVYRMFLEPEKPSRGCPLCRHVLHRPPFLDRIFKGIADVVLPAYVPSDEDVLRKAPKNDGWVKKLLWPPTAAAARNIRHKIRRGTTNDEVIVIEESSSDESVIQLEF